MVFKVHHAMVDGMSGVEITMVMHDLKADPGDDPEPVPRFSPKPIPDRMTIFQEAVRDRLTETTRRMTDDAFLELLAEVSLNDVRPLPYGPMPRPLLGMFQRVLDEHELAVEAAVTGDRQTLMKAFVASPLTYNLEDAENLIEELLRRERKLLPGYWFPKKKARTRRRKESK